MGLQFIRLIANHRRIGIRGVVAVTCGFVLASAPAWGGDAATDARTLIGLAACVSDADCHTVAIGHKSCGGPAVYLAWSSRLTDAQALNAAAARSATETPPDRSGMASTCSMVTDPGAHCQPVVGAPGESASAPAGLQGRCVLRRAAGAGSRELR